METATHEEVRRLTTDWPHLPPIEVVPAARDLPGRQSADAVGLFTPAALYLVAGQPARDVPRVIAHEATHATVRAELGRQDWCDFMAGVAAGARAGDPALALLRASIRARYVDARGEAYLPAVMEADEITAAAAEWALDPTAASFPVPNRRGAVWALLRGQFARRVLLLNVPVCRAQLLGMLVAVEHRLRTGRRLPALSGWWYSAAVPPTPKPMGPARPAVDHDESKRMLDRSTDWWEGMKEAAMLPILVLSAAGAIAGILYWVGLLLGLIRP